MKKSTACVGQTECSATTGTLTVSSSPLPFSQYRTTQQAVAGHTLAEIVEQHCILRSNAICAVVQINGHRIPRHLWRVVKPKPGTIVAINVVPQGGGGGGKKNPLATVLSLAVVIAAPYAVAAIGSAALGTSAASLTLAGRLAVAGIGIVGSLLVNAIAPPPTPSGGSFASSGGFQDASESPTQFIEGARNEVTPYGVVPINLGTNRVFPLQAANPYTLTENGVNSVVQLFTYGYGNVTVSDRKIGETALSEFKNVQLEDKLEGNLSSGTALFTNDVQQDQYSVTLTNSYTTRTTRIASDAAIVDVLFPRGLVQYNDAGNRVSRSVSIEVAYALTGTSPQVWTVSAGSYTAIPSQSVAPTFWEIPQVKNGSVWQSFAGHIVYLDKNTGTARILRDGNISTSETGARIRIEETAVPPGGIRLATIVTRSTTPTGGAPFTNSIVYLNDDRQAALVGLEFENSGSFFPSISGTNVAVAAGGLRLADDGVTAATAEPFIRSYPLTFPTPGQYDIRIKRNDTIENSDPRIFEETVLNSIKSISYTNPVALANISGTAMRIVADDQLNGAVEQYNVVLSQIILDYDADLDTWISRASSNPASIYRHILQSVANARPLTDAEIDLGALQEWHTYCETRGYTYNRYIDFDTSVIAMLRDVASAGAAAPTIIDGKYSVVVDKEKTDIVQMITPHNSWDFKGDLSMPDLPHAFRVEFRNAEAGYVIDERIVYADGYNEGNATLFEQLQYMSATNADLAYKHAKRFLATATLRPEVYSVMMDVENLVATRGDRVKVLHDVPLIGAGTGRITALTLSGGSPQYINAFTLDESIEVTSTQSYSARVRTYTGTEYFAVTPTTTGTATEFTINNPILNGTIEEGMLCGIVITGAEMDAIISRIEPQADLTARVTFLDYAPEIFDAETGTIPAFETNVTIPLSLQRPLPPLLEGEPLSGESVMLRASDGTVTTRMVIRLNNRNEGNVTPQVKIRAAGSTLFENAKLLQATADSISITDLTDAVRYDIHIRYRREGSTVLSAPLELNNQKFDGGSAIPATVTGFRVDVVGDTALLEWTPNTDIDLSHYELRFSRVFSGATWATAQLLRDNVKQTQLSVPFIGGTYLIKALDVLGNESATATTYITYDPSALRNVIQTITESPTFAGVKDNTVASPGGLQLVDTGLDGYYYFTAPFDQGGVFESYVSAKVIAGGSSFYDLYAEPDLFAMTDMYVGTSAYDLFTPADLYAIDDLFGIGEGVWSVVLEYRTTQDYGASPVVWSAWQEFRAGVIQFDAIDFRVKLSTVSQNVTPNITDLEVVIDMPDRIVRGAGLSVVPAGSTITYSPGFKATPSVLITLQDGATDDRIEFTAKTAAGFTFKVYNATTAGYVTRTYDYVASGYGFEG